MEFETMLFKVEDNIARITINRQNSFNAINGQASKDLHDIVNLMASNKDVRAVVITGSGDKAFCAGGDITEFHTNKHRLEALVREMTGYLHIAISRLAWLDAPVIAAVNGTAAGAGLSLSACCDLVIASDTAKFTSAYTRIGLTPDGSSTYFLSRIIGRRRALELYLTNRKLTAQEALDWGLVNRIVPAADLQKEVDQLARDLAAGPTLAHGGVKRLVLMSPNDTLESQMERETREIARMVGTEDAQNGIAAFISKQKPIFEGR
ncbi:MAG: enoyl-CoA hydratase-related protein [Proteobacteria bacterium]|nr:enoyl-CoA hydratase-related protein [Pseudomonadota bacterium]